MELKKKIAAREKEFKKYKEGCVAQYSRLLQATDNRHTIYTNNMEKLQALIDEKEAKMKE